MTTKSKAKPYTTFEIRKIKEMYESGSTYADIAQELNRSILSVMATTSRMIKSGQIRMIRCPSIIGLGGLTAAKTALDQAKRKANKYVNYTNSKGKVTHVIVANLEKQIARYTASDHN